MKITALVNLIAVSLLILIQSNLTFAQETLESPGSEIFQDAEKVLVKLSNQSPIVKKTTLTKLDSSVFFVNTSKDALLTIAIDFGKHKSHCSSGNLKWYKEEGILRSNEPIAPKDFAVMCFPESGTYNVSVYGLKNDGKAEITQVVVP